MNKLLLIFALLFLSGCELKEKLKENSKAPAFDEQIATEGDDLSTPINWAGTYKGILPCIDCEGIETTITINENMTFHIKTKYLGKEEMVYELRGDFLWNEEGNKIILNEKNRSPRLFLVGENYLLQLDSKGNKITGDSADKYYLYKLPSNK